MSTLAWSNFYDPLVDPVVLLGSGLSLLATALVLVTFIVYREEQRMFRHSLILNLMIAEFINSLNATLSGSYFLIVGEFRPGMLCSINGWLGQVSVQASDFSMLAIAVFTLLTITEKVYMPAVSKAKKILSCVSVWIVPLTTGCIAIGMKVMVPTGANWCWISPSRNDLRYGLTHGWRFAIIFAIIAIYSYVYYYTSRHFKSLASMPLPPTNAMANHDRKGPAQQTSPYKTPQQVQPLTPITPMSPEAVFNPPQRDSSWLRLSLSSAKDFPQWPKASVARDREPLLSRTVTAQTAPPPPYSQGEYGRDHQALAAQQFLVRQSLAPVGSFGTTTKIERVRAPETKRIEREVKRMLMMNAYPIFYVLLSVPGLVNRLLEASGRPDSGRLLDALQAASAFIGFTSAVTYGFNRHLRQRIAVDISNWRARRAARAYK